MWLQVSVEESDACQLSSQIRIPTNAHFDFFLKRSISILHANWKETQGEALSLDPELFKNFTNFQDV